MENLDAKLMEAVLKDSMLISNLQILALEYHAKAITPERFAVRVYELLHEHSKPTEPKGASHE